MNILQRFQRESIVLDMIKTIGKSKHKFNYIPTRLTTRHTINLFYKTTFDYLF